MKARTIAAAFAVASVGWITGVVLFGIVKGIMVVIVVSAGVTWLLARNDRAWTVRLDRAEHQRAIRHH